MRWLTTLIQLQALVAPFLATSSLAAPVESTFDVGRLETTALAPFGEGAPRSNPILDSIRYTYGCNLIVFP